MFDATRYDAARAQQPDVEARVHTRAMQQRYYVEKI